MEKLHPKSIWLFFFSFLFRGLIFFIFFSFWLAPFIGAILGVSDNGNVMGYIISFLIGWFIFFILYIVFCYIMAKLTYKYWKYELTEDVFRKESGVIWKKYVSIPYERIQNVDIYRGVFARILGLSDIQVQTAGASAVYYGRGGIAGVGAEGRLPGVDKETAEKLRDELIKRAKQSKQSI